MAPDEKGTYVDLDGDVNPVSELVAAARDGDHTSWNRLVDRYTPLLLSIIRRHRLQGDDAEVVVQTVWLRLVEKLGSIREPEALPGWILTTARNECLHVIKARTFVSPTDFEDRGWPDGAGPSALDSDSLTAERHEALLKALAVLPERQRALLLLLLEDPPPSYREISARLDVPVGSIGPTLARAVARVRAHDAVQALIDA
jgi:RNA polymerase sigma factor (sigma-70 family)